MQHPYRLHPLAVFFWIALALAAPMTWTAWACAETATGRPAFRDALSLPHGPAETAFLDSEEEESADPLARAAGPASLALPAGGEARLAGLARSPLLTFDLLLLTQRQNE